MKTVKKSLTIIFLLAFMLFIAIFTAACSPDPYKDYVSSELTPKTKICDSPDEWNNDVNKIKWLDSYSAYENFGVELGYTKAYFENNSLMVISKTGCSSDNLQFVDVLVNEGKLYPTFEINSYGPNDAITDDIIFYIFYVEVPISGNYKMGEIITENR